MISRYERLTIFGQDQREHNAIAGEKLFDRKAGQLFDAGADVEISGDAIPVARPPIEGAFRQAVAHRSQHRLALAQPFLVGDAFGDVRLNAIPDDVSVRLPLRARTQPHPAHLAILAANRGVHSEIGQVALGGLFSRQQLWQIFRQDLRVQQAGVGENLLDRNAGEPLNTGADI